MNLVVSPALQSQRSAHSKAFLDDSFITVDTISLDRHKLCYCAIVHLYDDLMVKNHPHIYLQVSCLQAVLVDSLMTIDMQSTDQSVAQLTTTTQELLKPLIAPSLRTPL